MNIEMMRRHSVFAMLIWCLFPGILLGSPAGFPTFHVSKIGNDQNEGTEQSPFLTINRGIAALAKKGTGSLIISGGDYRETLQLADLPSGHYVISRKEGSTVRILGSEPLSGWTKAPGMTYVFEIPFSYTVPKWSRHADPIFEDGNPSKKIEPRHSHPLQKKSFVPTAIYGYHRGCRHQYCRSNPRQLLYQRAKIISPCQQLYRS